MKSIDHDARLRKKRKIRRFTDADSLSYIVSNAVVCKTIDSPYTLKFFAFDKRDKECFQKALCQVV